jgi:hypothetical protein
MFFTLSVLKFDIFNDVNFQQLENIFSIVSTFFVLKEEILIKGKEEHSANIEFIFETFVVSNFEEIFI